MRKKKTGLYIFLGLIGALLIASLIVVIPMCYKHKEYRESMTAIEPTETHYGVTVMSCNVRCISIEDKGVKSWSYRAPYLKETIEQVNPDIIGFQEVTPVHTAYLREILSDYDYVIDYRDLFVLSEGCPIFYKKSKFTLIDKGSFWLSETPYKMSKSWDAACYRICSYVILEDKTTGKELVVFNTHLDHVSQEARIEGINLVLSKIKEFGFDTKASLLMGDMNDTVGSETINHLFSVFNDSASIAGKTMDDINHCTYQAWGTRLDSSRIDYIATSMTGIKVNSYEVIECVFETPDEGEIYASDHFPIAINISLTK